VKLTGLPAVNRYITWCTGPTFMLFQLWTGPCRKQNRTLIHLNAPHGLLPLPYRVHCAAVIHRV